MLLLYEKRTRRFPKPEAGSWIQKKKEIEIKLYSARVDGSDDGGGNGSDSGRGIDSVSVSVSDSDSSSESVTATTTSSFTTPLLL